MIARFPGKCCVLCALSAIRGGVDILRLPCGAGEVCACKRLRRHKVCSGGASRHDCPLPVVGSRCRNVRRKRSKRSKSGNRDSDGPSSKRLLREGCGVAGVGCPLASFGLSFPVVGCFLSCQNCSIKRTPGRTLLTPHPIMRTSVIGCFDVTLRFASPKSSSLACADVSLGGRLQCTGRAHRCKAKQSRRGRTAPTSDPTFTVVRFLGGIKRVRGFLW